MTKQSNCPIFTHPLPSQNKTFFNTKIIEKIHFDRKHNGYYDVSVDIKIRFQLIEGNKKPGRINLQLF